MRMEFTDAVLHQLLQEGMLRQSDSIVAVCAGVCDRDVFVRCGFRDVLITNINEADSRDESAPFEWEHQDAQDLDLEDESFDFAFVADGSIIAHRPIGRCSRCTVSRAGGSS